MTLVLFRLLPVLLLAMELLTLRELSAHLRLSPRTIRSWVQHPTQALPAFRIGGRLLFCKSEVDRWVEQFRVSPIDGDRIVDAIKEMFDEQEEAR